jgi:hypothetical protein
MKTPIVDVNLPNFIVRKQCCNCTEGKKGRERERERERGHKCELDHSG